MAKKKTEDKELKPQAEVKKPEAKKEAKVEIPNTRLVKIILNNDTKIRTVGHETATILIGKKKAKLA